jgi:large subunit ribosomal protein L9
MEVILLERVERLGQIGDVVSVKPGFARNFLLPQKKALRATEANRAVFENRRSEIEASNLQEKTEAEKVAEKVEGISVVLIRQASDSGQLYGSVNSRDVADALTEAGYSVERRQVILDQAIKVLGLHAIRVRLHPEVTVTVTANVAKTDDEAVLQQERGGAIGQGELEAEADAAEAARQAAEEALALADDKSAVAEAAEGLVDEDVEQKLQSEAVEETEDGAEPSDASAETAPDVDEGGGDAKDGAAEGEDTKEDS